MIYKAQSSQVSEILKLLTSLKDFFKPINVVCHEWNFIVFRVSILEMQKKQMCLNWEYANIRREKQPY